METETGETEEVVGDGETSAGGGMRIGNSREMGKGLGGKGVFVSELGRVGGLFFPTSGSSEGDGVEKGELDLLKGLDSNLGRVLAFFP